MNHSLTGKGYENGKLLAAGQSRLESSAGIELIVTKRLINGSPDVSVGGVTVVVAGRGRRV